MARSKVRALGRIRLGSLAVLVSLLAAPTGVGRFARADAQAPPVLVPVQFHPMPEPMPMPMPMPMPRPMPMPEPIRPLPEPIQPQQLPEPARPIDISPGQGQGSSSPDNPQSQPAADLDSVADGVFDQDIASLPIVVKARGATG